MRFAAGVFVAFVSLILAGAAFAAETPPGAPPEPPAAAAARADRLDKLFSDLKSEKSDDAAKGIEASIWDLWMQSGDPQVDKLMTYAIAAMDNRSFQLAVDFLDVMVKLRPDFAEGWNKRATVFWLMRDYPSSLADIEKTLALEPRHFGALSGLGMIMRDMGEKQKAVNAFKRALAVDPHLDGVKATIDQLESELGRDI